MQGYSYGGRDGKKVGHDARDLAFCWSQCFIDLLSGHCLSNFCKMPLKGNCSSKLLMLCCSMLCVLYYANKIVCHAELIWQQLAVELPWTLSRYNMISSTSATNINMLMIYHWSRMSFFVFIFILKFILKLHFFHTRHLKN